ncbi:putative penicillin-binding protein [Xylaria intraflava]|nr:putative penicillin-binding protein [Xylaria intraflava]
MTPFLLGPIYEPPSGLLVSGFINAWASRLSTTMNHILESGHSDFGGFEANTSSISITVTSTEDHEDTPFFDFHYSSPQVTRNSVYRIGSVSKLFAVYALLVEHGRPIEDAYWDRITIGALASQLSGFGRDYANADLADQNFPWKRARFPALPAFDIPTCAGNDSLPPCNRQEYFHGLLRKHPVFAPRTTPVYSNAAYRILGYVLEAMVGAPYHAFLQSAVLGPLGLADTPATLPPNRGSWVIPGGNRSDFHLDFGDEMPTAGIYSSSGDLAKFGRSILLHRQLSALDTRRWMKLGSHTSNPFFSVGSPWEIVRARSQITSGRVIDLYTKSGAVGQYNTQIILLPDHGVVLSILGAGSSSGDTVITAAEAVLQSLIPALENVTLACACERICGTYESSQPNVNSSITVAGDETGLYLQRWINQGVDIEVVARAYARDTEPSGAGHRVTYRVAFDMTGEDPDGPPRVLDQGSQWDAIDLIVYGDVSVYDLVICFDANGTAITIEPRVLRDVLHRSS